MSGLWSLVPLEIRNARLQIHVPLEIQEFWGSRAASIWECQGSEATFCWKSGEVRSHIPVEIWEFQGSRNWGESGL